MFSGQLTTPDRFSYHTGRAEAADNSLSAPPLNFNGRRAAADNLSAHHQCHTGMSNCFLYYSCFSWFRNKCIRHRRSKLTGAKSSITRCLFITWSQMRERDDVSNDASASHRNFFWIISALILKLRLSKHQSVLQKRCSNSTKKEILRLRRGSDELANHDKCCRLSNTCHDSEEKNLPP